MTLSIARVDDNRVIHISTSSSTYSIAPDRGVLLLVLLGGGAPCFSNHCRLIAKNGAFYHSGRLPCLVICVFFSLSEVSARLQTDWSQL